MTHYPSIQEIISEDEWQISPERERLYTSNHLIDAYLKGKTDGLNAELQLILDQLKANIKESAHITSTITLLLRNREIIAESAYLKIVNWNDFELLLFVPERDLIGDNIIAIYSEIAEIEDNRKTDHFSISISLGSKNESFRVCWGIENTRDRFNFVVTKPQSIEQTVYRTDRSPMGGNFTIF